MNEARPDPDQLLAAVSAEEARARRGKLRIFFGGSAGVGKTYSMLEAAHHVRATGVDLVLGYVEPHGRVETDRLRAGLEQLPTLPVRHRGLIRHEFDLDAALRRRPAILLVDELAHSNLIEGEPAPRHAKRWQDIEELLDAGINVWTTVNVQHLESLNDLVAQITGVRQRETVPDRIFDEADEVELIDLPPDDLLARLKAGRIYLPEEARTAADRFFRKSNLIALRELALRRMADRVDASARATTTLDRASRAWMARDRLLVAVGPDEQAEQLVRAGKRMADALDAVWFVVYVETPELLRLSQRERNRRIDVLRLAESLGGETVTLDGPTAAETLSEYAQTRNATRVIVGAPKRRGWRTLLRPSTGTALARNAKGFDVISIAPADTLTRTSEPRTEAPEVAMPIHWDRYAWALATTVICTVIGFAMRSSFEPANIVMVYVLGATIASVRFGRGPAVLTAVVNVLAFDYCFVPPQFTFSVADAQYVVTFVIMLIVTLVIANLMASVRQQTRVAGARERRTYLLYAMSRELAATRGIAEMARVAVRHVAEVFQCQAVVLLPDSSGKLRHPRELPEMGSLRAADLSIAQWVLDHGRRAGLDSDTLPAAPALYLPLGSDLQRLGVLAVLPQNRRRVLLPEQRHLLETFAAQIGLAVERGQLAEVAESSRVAAETESLRNTLLASISHDLRTPLAVIAGASSTLAEHGARLDETMRLKLAQSIENKAREMTELVSNVLDLMRFESGQVAMRRDWETLDDLLGSALSRMQERLGAHTVTTRLPADLPAVYVDASLIVQVFINLLDNVVKYTPPATPVTISAAASGDFVRITCDDAGPGLPPGETDRLFDKFQRGSEEGATIGAGLGLAICRAIVRAHGGDIGAGTRPEGGASFVFTLPLKDAAA
ncbi:MAG: sensor histidine kinase KdpD [Pseudomonadota bacterium]|nr:sensor histidine kinase KdpD [Pseudomonadota bacterium]